MAGIDNITNAILQEAKEKAASVISAAESKAAESRAAAEREGKERLHLQNAGGSTRC